MARPTWIEIDLDRLAHNMREIRRVVQPGKLVTAVIKANGYGHGAVEIGQTLLDNGADRFAVATFTEALELRRAYPEVPILVLGYTREEDFTLAERHDIMLTLFDFEQAQRIADHHTGIKVHLKINTGMNRLGFRPDDPMLVETLKLFSLDIEGIFSHFAKSDEKDKSFTRLQAQRFEKALDVCAKTGRSIPIRHIANSAAIIDHPEYQYDMVRAGIMLYGQYPSEEVDHDAVELRQSLSLKARVAMVQTLQPGEGVSYGQIYQADHPQKIATLPVGYADGWTRLMTGKAEVVFNGQRRPIVGRICMDQCMMDAEGLDLKRDNIVEIIGDDMTVDEVAGRLGTISNEVLCMMGRRLPRVYLKDGVPVKTVDYLNPML